MEKTLRLFTYVDGGTNDTPFPSEEDQIEIGAFRYDAKRMGGAPIITATIMYPTCLDKVWNDMVYASLNGEKYFLKQTPTSSKSNDDARYKHDIELIAERTILDNTYFYDAVVGNPIENDVPITNSTKFNFYGHIEKFVERMNASLQYTGIQKVDENGNVIGGYRVVLDNDVVKRDQKQVSFDSAVFSQALQEAYNTFGIPFYFDGKTIHVGFSNNIINDVLEYGVDGALLSATKTNANFKVVNRATGNGSSDNIPYYYPNNSPKGEIGVEVNTTSKDFVVEIKEYDVFADKVSLDESLVYGSEDATLLSSITSSNTDFNTSSYQLISSVEASFTSNSQCRVIAVFNASDSYVIKEEGYYAAYGAANTLYKYDHYLDSQTIKNAFANVYKDNVFSHKINNVIDLNNPIEVDFILDKECTIRIDVCFSLDPISKIDPKWRPSRVYLEGGCSWDLSATHDGKYAIWFKGEEAIELEEVGLSYTGTPNIGDTITQRLIKKVNTSSTLQPSIYRATDGKERFYNAINYPFAFVAGYELKYGEYVLDGEVHNDAYKKDDGTYYEFTNEYKEGRPREHVFTVDDIKPTIKEMTNNISWVEKDEEGNDKTVFQRIDMFSEFAYNIDDNDETYIDPNGNTSFKHPYFFAKLRKLDFNLFDSASELGEMTFSMTSGNCGACNFKIGVSEDYPQYNTVQVDENGNLVYDENGYVLCGLEDFQGEVEPQDRQQDTVNYEVWIALKKEEDTYGILMPKAPVDGVGGHRPVACSSDNANDGDTFVILNINLPEEYIYKAEKKLEKSIVKYIWENNVEKFNFSVNFSRIFLEENPNILNSLNENARLTRVKYNGDEYILYVSSYSYSMNEGDVLPEIRVELDDTLTIAQNALQNAINEVKSDIAGAINAIDVAAIGSRYFLRKDTYDVAEAPIGFKKGVIFGDNGMVEVNEDGTSKLTIDYLDVTRKATFTSLEIQEQSHVGGQILITPASMVCNGVEELEDAYRCYFETQGDGGEEIFNQFVEGDQAISQTFNEWGGHYYWRLVTGIGRNYIDLSKTDCAPESDIPKAGNKIIQLGNRTNASRQAAQVLSSHGASSPSFIMYNGINSFSLDGKEVTGILWNPETQEPQMYSYGSFFFGDRKLDGNYITFQKKDGDTEKTLTINADVQLGGGSTGLSNLSEWKEQDEKVTQAANDASTAKQQANTANATATEAKNTANTANTNATTAKNTADNAVQKAQKAQDDATQAKKDAEAARSLANNAQSVANAASQRLNEWASDGIISPVEKQALKNELAVVNSDYDDIHKQYEKYIQEFDKFILTDGKYYVTEDGYIFNVEVANSNWSSFRSAYQSYVAELTLKTSTSESVEVGDLTTKQNAYYSARTAMLEDISLSIKAEADYSKKRANQAIQDASNAKGVADTANASVITLGTRIDGVDKTIAEINNKLDGVVESYFDDYIPSRDNLPASEWIANETEADHIGDTFTNTALNGDGAGQSWRWLEQADGSYNWQLIADSDAAKALALAGQAKAAADGKTKTFLVTPTNYNIGDIWIVGDTVPVGFAFKKGDILTTDSASVEYTASHWSKVINYNDEFQSTLDAKVGELNDAIDNIEQNATDYTDEVKTALQTSINALNEAKANVNAVYTIAQADGKISESEQRAIDAAGDYAKVAQASAEANVKAWADGEIKEAERSAINTANANLEAAKIELNKSIASLEEKTNQAIQDADNAQSAAESAQNEASSATSVSNAAKALADAADALSKQADSNASKAVNSASDAQTKASAAQGIAQEAKETAESANNLANTARTNAENAVREAGEAKQEAESATSKLNSWADDKVISPFEKQGVKDEYAFVVADKEDINKQATKYGVSISSFNQAYNAYAGYLFTIIKSTEETVNIPSDMSAKQSAYYTQRTTILDSIATAAKKVATDAQTAADTANQAANNAQQQADKAIADARDAQSTANNAQAIASSATSKLNEWASDNVISPLEKEGLRTELAFILGDYNDIQKNYIKYIQEFDKLILQDGKQYVTVDGFVFNVEVANTNWEAYKSAYNAYKSDLESKTANNDTVAIGTLKTTQSAYYNKRALVLEDITLAIKAEADYATEQSRVAKKEAEEAKAEIADYEYLKNALGNAKSLAVEGVVMSQMVAVAEKEDAESVTEADVVAFLNGSGVARDDEHGKMILAAGIPENGGDLEQRSKEASTRIYEDGCTFTKKMHLEDGCTIGENIIVTDVGIKIENHTSHGGTTFLGGGGFTYDGLIETTYPSGIPKWEGTNVNVGGCGNVGIRIGVGENGHEATAYCPSKGGEIGILVGNDSNKDAIRCESGLFAGLRPKTRVITTSTPVVDRTLTELDHTIIINIESGHVTIKTPSAPQDGQVYEIYTCHHTMDLTIDFNGKSAYSFIEATNKPLDTFTTDYRRHITLIYAGGQWWEDYRYLQ